MTFLSTLPFIAHPSDTFRTRFKICLCYCFLNQSLLKNRIQKICTHVYLKFLCPNKYQLYFFNRFHLNKP